MRRVFVVALGLAIPMAAVTAATVPDSLQLSCDVDRTAFRKLASAATSVTFRLWDAAAGGSQCGSDHVVATANVLALRPKGDKFDGQRPRKFLELRAVLGTAGDSGVPVELCAGDETWVDVQVGATTLTCDFSADPNSKQGVAPDAPLRRRLQPVAFAQESAHADTCDECAGTQDVSVRVTSSVAIPTNHFAVVALPFDTERWDTANMHVGASPTRLTATVAGKYYIFGHVQWAPGNRVGVRNMLVRLNGNTIIAELTLLASNDTPTATTVSSVSTHYQLGVGDYVELFVSHSDGGSLDVLASESRSPEFGMVKVP